MCLALPATIERTFEDGDVPMAEVNQGGVRRVVCLIYQPDAGVGDRVVIHSGFAIAKDDADAGVRWADIP